jgi:hypothetical protein
MPSTTRGRISSEEWLGVGERVWSKAARTFRANRARLNSFLRNARSSHPERSAGGGQSAGAGAQSKDPVELPATTNSEETQQDFE